MSLDATFNGIAASSVGIKILSANRSVLPAMRDNKIDIPGRPGSVFYPAVPGDRKITVTVGLVGTGPQDYQAKLRALGGWLWTRGKQQLVFSDEPDKYWNAAVSPVDSLDLERDIEMGTVDIEFVADAYAYKTVNETVLWDTAASPTITVNNGGSVDADLEFVVTAVESVSIPRFRRDPGLMVLPNLAAGATMEISGVSKTIKLNGVSNWSGIGGDFLTLQPGSNTLAYGSNGGNVTVQVSWRPRWL